MPDEPFVSDEVPYDDDHVLCVHVEMDASDYDDMRHQARDISVVYTNTNCDAPFLSPYTWFEADIVVDGNPVDTVGVRNKGFVGSISSQRPSLKIKTDKYVDNQELFSTERITLNNNNHEPTRIRTCLGYALFAAAGVPAPRCNWAVVEVNGTPLGVYAHVEPVKKRFLRRHFGNDDGDLYEATFTDVVEGWYGRFEAKTSETSAVMLRLRQLEAALLIVDDDDFVSRIAEVLDVDAFLRFWAMEVLLDHGDGCSGNINNYYIYFDPDDGNRAQFIPWSTDGVLSADGPTTGDGTLHTYTRGRVIARMSRSPTLSLRMRDALRDVVDDVWDEDRLLADIDTWAALVRQGQSSPTYDDDLGVLRDIVRNRRAVVEGMLDDGVPVRGVDVDACTPFAGR